MRAAARRIRALLTTTLLFAACRHVRSEASRAPEPIPPALARYYGPAEEGIRPVLRELERTPGYVVRIGRPARGSGMPCGFEYYRPRTSRSFPLVFVLPILGGDGSLTRNISRSLAERGLGVIHLLRPEDLFHETQDAAYLEGLLRETVATARGLLDWAIAEGGADPERIGLVGISLGGVVGTALLASEPRIRRAVIALAGAGVPEIVARSEESSLRRYVRALTGRGIALDAIAADFEQNLRSDPDHLARYVDPKGVLFIRAAFDRVIPAANAERLWEKLGRPERLDIPTGHYTAALLLPYLRAKVAAHLRSWDEAPATASIRPKEPSPPVAASSR